MIVYEFRCKACGTLIQQPSRTPPICCNTEAKRVYKAPNTIFRGKDFTLSAKD